ncbi:hypothetical protein [Staphylococcus gallinarum]|uniref:hypothetical protein n=1 Tax=Staphylococcus gallinarum TaxID=1293 RepID=UPI001E58F044|nr:hypothetical protein [Staphylococcus gallinarum]MCD8845216.1 hypothetical protein [Staphylococcus gallinarum]
MKRFKSIKAAFKWAFNEKEDLFKIKSTFKLGLEVETINEVFDSIALKDLEKYMLDHTYIYINKTGIYEFNEEINAN